MNTKTFDDGGTPDVGAMLARLKLTGELGKLKKQIEGLGTAATDMLAKLKLTAQSNQVRKQLGGGAVTSPAPAPDSNFTAYMQALRQIAAGERDSEGVVALYGAIKEAVDGMNESDEVPDDAEATANDAITHWAELEERLSVST